MDVVDVTDVINDRPSDLVGLDDAGEHVTDGEVGLTVHSVLGLSDLSRSDVLVDDDGVVWFLEVNVAPGMTETSLMPQAISAAELSVGDVLAGIIESD